MWVIDINSTQDLWSKDRRERMRKRESKRKRRGLVGRKRKHDVREDVKAWLRSKKLTLKMCDMIKKKEVVFCLCNV